MSPLQKSFLMMENWKDKHRNFLCVHFSAYVIACVLNPLRLSTRKKKLLNFCTRFSPFEFSWRRFFTDRFQQNFSQVFHSQLVIVGDSTYQDSRVHFVRVNKPDWFYLDESFESQRLWRKKNFWDFMINWKSFVSTWFATSIISVTCVIITFTWWRRNSRMVPARLLRIILAVYVEVWSWWIQ